MSKSNVKPNHDKVSRARQAEDIAQIRNKQKDAEVLVRERTGKGARSRTPAPDARPKAARAVKPSTGGATQLSATQAAKLASVNLQAGDKRGKRSTAQKRASARHEFGPMPPTKAVAGAFGKEPSPRRRPNRKG